MLESSPISDEISVPFNYAQPLVPHSELDTTHLVVMLSINGCKPLPFVVDTGYNSGLLLAYWAGYSLGLRGGKTGYTSKPNRIKIRKCPVESVKIITSESKTLDLAISEVRVAGYKPLGLDTMRSSGLLGVAAYDNSAIRIDFDKKTLVLNSKKHPSAGAISLPMFRKKPRGHFYVKGVLPNDTDVEFLIDTGSESSHITGQLASNIMPIGRRDIIIQSSTSHRYTAQVLLPYVQIGEFVEHNVAFDVNPYFEDCVLGLNILSRFEVTLDFPNEELLLNRSLTYADRIKLPGTIGLRIARRRGWFSKEQFVVIRVHNGSAAQAQGVRVGDRLLEIDGEAIQGLEENEAIQKLRGKVDTSVHLILQRGRTVYQAALTRQSIYSS